MNTKELDAKYIAGTYARFQAAQSAAAGYSGAFPAYISGSFVVRMGSYASSSAAQSAAASVGGTAVSPSSTGVTVIVTGTDTQGNERRTTNHTVVRSIFCVYCADEQEGGLMLLALMERLRIALLKQVVIGNQFALNTQAGLETMYYPDDTAPYFSGEMISTWRLPGIQREV